MALLSAIDRGDLLAAVEKSEQILFQIAANQRNLAEAREHLVSAIDSGGLNDDEIVRSLNTIRAIDEQVAGGPQ